MSTSALRQTMLYGLALALPKLIGFAMVPVTTQFMSPAEFGRLDVLQTLADVLGLMIAAGMAETLFRFGATSEQKKVGAELMGFAFCASLLVLILGQLAAPFIASQLPGGISTIDTRLLLLNLAFSGLILISLSWLRLTNRALGYVVAAVGRVGLQAAGATIALVMGFGMTGVLTAGAVSGGLVVTILFIGQMRETGLSINIKAWSRYLSFGGPLVLAGLAGFALGSFDRLILAGIIGPAAMAAYAVAVKFGVMTAILVQPFELWWLPRRFKVLDQANGTAEATRLTSIGVAVACFAALIIAWGAPSAIKLVTPPAYHDAIAYLPWLAIIGAIHAATHLLNFGFHIAQKTGRIAMIDGAAAGLVLGLYVLLIPDYGVEGAIFATLLAQALRLSLTIYGAQRAHRLPYPLVKLVALGAVTISAILAVPASLSLLYATLQVSSGLLGLAGLGMLLGLLPKPALRPFTPSRAGASQ